MSNIVISVPSIKPAFRYLVQVAKEIALSAIIAGALAGLTAAGNAIPEVGDHYGWSPLVTFQLVTLIGSARAFVSGLSSKKVNDPVVTVVHPAPEGFAKVGSNTMGSSTEPVAETREPFIP